MQRVWAFCIPGLSLVTSSRDKNKAKRCTVDWLWLIALRFLQTNPKKACSLLHINLLALVIPSTSQVSFGFKTFQGWWHILSSVRKIQTCEDSQRGAACVGLTSHICSKCRADTTVCHQSAILLFFNVFVHSPRPWHLVPQKGTLPTTGSKVSSSAFEERRLWNVGSARDCPTSRGTGCSLWSRLQNVNVMWMWMHSADIFQTKKAI